MSIFSSDTQATKDSEQDLYNWLKHHNQSLCGKYEAKFKDEHYKSLIQKGLKNDKFSEQDVNILLQFAQTDEVDTLKVGKKTLVAVETILKNKENKKRFKAGLNPITLLAEHKRKVILNAMTEGLVTEIHESRSKSQEKLATYLEESDAPAYAVPHPLRARGSSFSSAFSEHSSHHNSSQHSKEIRHFKKELGPAALRKKLQQSEPYLHYLNNGSDEQRVLTTEPSPRQVLPSIGESNSPFRPKWEDYRTMRTRWTYVQPQVKRLQNKETMFAPVDNTRCVILGNRKNHSVSESNNNLSEDFNNKTSNPTNIDNTGPAYNVLNGNVVDTTHYHTSNQRIHSRRSKILEKTADLRQIELDKRKTYVYSHALRGFCETAIEVVD